MADDASTWQLVGRDRELELLLRWLGPGTDGVRVAVLHGDPGVGVTTVAATAAWTIADDERDVTWLAGSIDSIPGASELALLHGVAARSDPNAAADEVATLVHERAASRPQLLVLDADEDPDALTLLALERILADHECNVSLLVATRRSMLAGTPLARLVDRARARLPVGDVALEPLPEHELRRIVDLHAPTAPATHRSLVAHAAGGDAWLAVALATGGPSSTRIPEDAWDRLDAVRDEVGVFATRLLDAAAALDVPIDATTALAVVEVPIDDFADVAERLRSAGVARIDRGGRMSIRQPIVGQMLRRELDDATCRGWRHAALAAWSTPQDPSASARDAAHVLRLLGDRTDAARRLMAAARECTRAGDPLAALELLEDADDPSADSALRVERLRQAASVARLVDPSRCNDLLVRLLRLADQVDDDEATAFALEQLYWLEGDERGRPRLERAVALGDERVGWAARAAASLAIIDGDYERAIRHDERALELAAALGDDELQARATEKLALSTSYVGDLAAAALLYRMAADASRDAGRHRAYVIALLSLSDVQAELLDATGSHESLTEARGWVADLELDRLAPLVDTIGALAALRIGDLERAAQLARSAVEHPAASLDNEYPVFVDVRAAVAVEQGDLEAAGLLVEQSRQLADASDDTSYVEESRFTEARLLAARGELDAAAAAVRTHPPTQALVRVGVAAWAARIGLLHDHARSIELARDIASSTALGESPYCDLAVREAFDAVDAFAGDEDALDRLRAVSAAWDEAGFALDAARALAAVASRGGPSAIEELRDAASRLASFGARRDADVVASRLRRLGATPVGSTRRAGEDELTDRELEVARLAAGGARNRDIAARLAIGESTVERHLGRTYGKLRITRRAELAAALAAAGLA